MTVQPALAQTRPAPITKDSKAGHLLGQRRAWIGHDSELSRRDREAAPNLVGQIPPSRSLPRREQAPMSSGRGDGRAAPKATANISEEQDRGQRPSLSHVAQVKKAHGRARIARDSRAMLAGPWVAPACSFRALSKRIRSRFEAALVGMHQARSMWPAGVRRVPAPPAQAGRMVRAAGTAAQPRSCPSPHSEAFPGRSPARVSPSPARKVLLHSCARS